MISKVNVLFLQALIVQLESALAANEMDSAENSALVRYFRRKASINKRNTELVNSMLGLPKNIFKAGKWRLNILNFKFDNCLIASICIWNGNIIDVICLRWRLRCIFLCIYYQLFNKMQKTCPKFISKWPWAWRPNLCMKGQHLLPPGWVEWSFFCQYKNINDYELRRKAGSVLYEITRLNLRLLSWYLVYKLLSRLEFKYIILNSSSNSLITTLDR